MASTYLRPDSPYIWIRYKDATGKWKNANSGYRKDNLGDRRNAKLVAREKSLEEAKQRILTPGRSAFVEWLPSWIEQRWQDKSSLTLRKYRLYCRTWLEYLDGIGANSPATVTRESVLNYEQYRRKQGTARNTVLQEIGFFGQVLDEAISRGYATTNVARHLRLASTPRKHKEVWTDDQIQLAIDAAEKADRFGWIHTVLLMGRFQAARLSSCEVPLAAISLERREIRYPAIVMKGGKAFTQAIDPRFLPILAEIVAHRRTLGESTLCSLPSNPSPSMELRRFLDALGLHGLSQHGLRTSWVTRAALSGIPESATMKFTNHSSREVHAVYTRLSSGDVVQFFDRLK